MDRHTCRGVQKPILCYYTVLMAIITKNDNKMRARLENKEKEKNIWVREALLVFQAEFVRVRFPCKFLLIFHANWPQIVWPDESSRIRWCQFASGNRLCFPVLKPASVRVRRIRMTVRPLQRLRLRCTIRGNPLPWVYWTKDGQPLKNDNR